jgi:predicted nuclease of predicted toxin-antitoxin system
LKRRGIHASSAKDINKLGLTDEKQLEIAIQQNAVILTNDADFIRIAVHRNHTGIIYLQQHKLTIGECIQKLKILAETKTNEQMKNQIIFL